MDSVFSVDDIVGQFWSPPPIRLSQAAEEGSLSYVSKMMNRSSSEWAFQRFLLEASALESSAPSSSSRTVNDLVEVKKHDQPATTTTAASFTAGPPDFPINSDEYQAFLKRRLNLACAAVALTRATSAKPQDSAALPENGSQASNTSQLGSQVPSKASRYDFSKGQDKDFGGPFEIPSPPAMPKKSAVQVTPVTSGSSSELSDDDELEGETETTQNMDLADAKRVRRMLSNRDSARRSRRRKQAQLTELETKVSQLGVESSSLLKRLTDISQKYNVAAVDNRVLKADVETLRAKVKMAEEKVKRVTGLNPLFQAAMSEMSTIAMPSFACSPSDTSADAAVPVQDGPKQDFYRQSASNNPMSSHDPRIQNGLVDVPSVDYVTQQNPVPAVAVAEQVQCGEWLAWSTCRSGFVGAQVLVGPSAVESSSSNDQKRPTAVEILFGAKE